MDVAFFTHTVALAALAVVAIQQVLKLKVIPIAFANRYPVPTLILLSIGASIFVVWQSAVAMPTRWTDWLLLVATTAVVAAITYNNTIKNWVQLRSLEGEGKADV